MNPQIEVETANYEIGLSIVNLNKKIDGIDDGTIRQRFKSIRDKLDALFSSLPAKPWLMEGFGHPEVESRFNNKK